MGKSPEEAYYNQKQMRRHLCQCLVAGVMCPFPQSVGQGSFELPRPARRQLSLTSLLPLSYARYFQHKCDHLAVIIARDGIISPVLASRRRSQKSGNAPYVFKISL